MSHSSLAAGPRVGPPTVSRHDPDSKARCRLSGVLPPSPARLHIRHSPGCGVGPPTVSECVTARGVRCAASERNCCSTVLLGHPGRRRTEETHKHYNGVCRLGHPGRTTITPSPTRHPIRLSPGRGPGSGHPQVLRLLVPSVWPASPLSPFRPGRPGCRRHADSETNIPNGRSLSCTDDRISVRKRVSPAPRWCRASLVMLSRTWF